MFVTKTRQIKALHTPHMVTVLEMFQVGLPFYFFPLKPNQELNHDHQQGKKRLQQADIGSGMHDASDDRIAASRAVAVTGAVAIAFEITIAIAVTITITITITGTRSR